VSLLNPIIPYREALFAAFPPDTTTPPDQRNGGSRLRVSTNPRANPFLPSEPVWRRLVSPTRPPYRFGAG
jgi:hypothetical protein